MPTIDGKPIHNAFLLEMADVTLAQLDGWVAQFSEEDLGNIARYLTSATEHFARRAAYIEERYGYGGGDQGHACGVKKQNRIAAKVRKAFGYTYPKQDITF